MEFALQFQMESPIKKGHYSAHDRFVHERVLAQVQWRIVYFVKYPILKFHILIPDLMVSVSNLSCCMVFCIVAEFCDM